MPMVSLVRGSGLGRRRASIPVILISRYRVPGALRYALPPLTQADTAALLTALVLHTVPEFAVELEQLHNDSTSITFHGSYPSQSDGEEESQAPRITYGHNKDHRPDLKQLLYCVTVSADLISRCAAPGASVTSTPVPRSMRM